MGARPALCSVCNAIDFSQATNLDIDRPAIKGGAHDQYYRVLSPVGTAYRDLLRQALACPLCPLLRATRRSPQRGCLDDSVYISLLKDGGVCGFADGSGVPGGAGVFEVAVRPLNGPQDVRRPSKKSTVVLAVHPSRVARRFDPRLPLWWLAWCEGNHDGCRVAIGMQPSHPIRLVDCKARSLVQHDGKAPYVALSYVWGKHTEESTEKQKEGANSPDFERGKLPENITAVIEDAMVVTQQLGYQLLWVDRYCIDQEDRISADQQINQMDRIYNGAEITLVAAAGEDGNYGLAGVNREFFARLESSRIETGPDGAVLMSITSGSSTFSFEYQKWSTRGWTFQEALLSRRCLVFTENWIFFQCGKVHCYTRQGLQPPFGPLPSPDSDQELKLGAPTSGRYTRLWAQFPRSYAERLNPASRDDAYGALRPLCELIQEYTKRELTYEKDALRAIQGVLNRYIDLHHKQIHHLWGIPFISPDPLRDGSVFTECLAWVSASMNGPFFLSRRRDFPSWSWAGWKGRIEYSLPRNEAHLSNRAVLCSTRDSKRGAGSVLELEAMFIPPGDFRRRGDFEITLSNYHDLRCHIYDMGQNQKKIRDDMLSGHERTRVCVMYEFLTSHTRGLHGLLLAPALENAEASDNAGMYYQRIGDVRAIAWINGAQTIPGRMEVSQTQAHSHGERTWSVEKFILV